MKKELLWLFFVVVMSLSCFKIPALISYPNYWPKPVYNFNSNPITADKILLGKVLFYDPILSQDSTISCASCHSSYAAFTHVDHPTSHGINDGIGNRNAPALFNLAWQKKFMWDGAISHLDFQVLAPIANKSEMGSDLKTVLQRVNKNKRYHELIVKAYKTEQLSGEQLLKAMAQFLLSLISADSKYDRVRAGKEQFTEQEATGYALFQENCASCHTEPFFTNHDFAKNDLPIDPNLNDLGRYEITKNKKDSLHFKVPSLRNIAFTYPYMHDGRFKKLAEVLNHYQTGVSNGDARLPAKNHLTSRDKIDIIAFLMCLSDNGFVQNKAFQFPINNFKQQNP